MADRQAPTIPGVSGVAGVPVARSLRVGAGARGEATTRASGLKRAHFTGARVRSLHCCRHVAVFDFERLWKRASGDQYLPLFSFS